MKDSQRGEGKNSSFNCNIFKRRFTFLSKVAKINFVESISIVDSIQSVYFSLLLIRDILARMNQDLLGRTGRVRHNATFLIFVRLASQLYYYIILTCLYTDTRARTRRARNSIYRQNWIHGGYRLSSRERRVAGPTPVVVLNIRLSRALIV